MHIIDGAFKAGVFDVQSEDRLLDISITRAKINKAITWIKKSQKGAVALNQAQTCCKLSNVRLLAPTKTFFAYILHSLKSLLIKKDDIEYMYCPMPGVGN